jgi:hypothetical protein
MTFGAIATGVNIAAGLNAVTGGSVTKALGFGGSGSGASTGAGSATATANPMAPYQAQLAQMYAGYLQPGQNAAPQAMPGYTQYQTGVVNPAEQTAQRTAASAGMLYSGNEAQALQGVSQQGYSGFMNNYLSQLSGGAGAGFNPAAAAQLGVNQQNAQQQAIMQGIGGIATGAASLYGQYGSGSANTSAMSTPAYQTQGGNYNSTPQNSSNSDISNSLF